jgi:hypothetical protein
MINSILTNAIEKCAVSLQRRAEGRKTPESLKRPVKETEVICQLSEQ